MNADESAADRPSAFIRGSQWKSCSSYADTWKHMARYLGSASVFIQWFLCLMIPYFLKICLYWHLGALSLILWLSLINVEKSACWSLSEENSIFSQLFVIIKLFHYQSISGRAPASGTSKKTWSRPVWIAKSEQRSNLWIRGNRKGEFYNSPLNKFRYTHFHIFFKFF